MSRVNKKVFGEYMRKKRQELGLTQEELALRLNVSNMTVSKWENGKRYPDFEMLDDISEVFQVSVEDIYENSRGGEERSFNFSTGIIALILMVGIIGATGVLNSSKPKDKDSDEYILSLDTYYMDGNPYQEGLYFNIISEEKISIEPSPTLISEAGWKKEYTYDRDGNNLHLDKDEGAIDYPDEYSPLGDEIDIEIINNDTFIFEGNMYMRNQEYVTIADEDVEYIVSNGTYLKKNDEMKGYINIDIENNLVRIGHSAWASYADFFTCERDGSILYLKAENMKDRFIEIIDDNTLFYEGAVYNLDTIWTEGMIIQTKNGTLIYLQGTGLSDISNLTELENYYNIKQMKTGDRVRVYCDSDSNVLASNPCILSVKEIVLEDNNNIVMTDEKGNIVSDEDLINRLCEEYKSFEIIVQ